MGGARRRGIVHWTVQRLSSQGQVKGQVKAVLAGEFVKPGLLTDRCGYLRQIESFLSTNVRGRGKFTSNA